tara:strand:- start:1876 stop:2721 length:846 start_codon:yes stop_codon:yes gene_type:complete
MKNLIVMGPGESVFDVAKEIKTRKNTELLGLQWVFPYTHKLFGFVPDYWTWGDPHGAIAGLKYVLENHTRNPEIKSMKILVPHFVCSTYQEFRNYFGTTPLGRSPSLWEEYLDLLSRVSEILSVEQISSTTTKNIFLFPEDNRDLLGDIHGEESFARFMQAPVFGTVKYDSDRIIGSINKWGMENKISSIMFPLAHYLGAENVYCIGFDFIGSRIYDKSRSRHAWGNDITTLNENIKFSLSLVEKWQEWGSYHNMELYSIAPASTSLLNLVMPYKSVSDIK